MKKYTVALSHKARDGLREIYDFLASSTLNREFSDSFVMGLRHYMESLGYFPERFPLFRDNVRRAVYPGNANYLIFFEIDEDVSEIHVLKVVNAKRYTEYKDLM